MWLPISTMTTLCVLLDLAEVMGNPDADALEISFRERTREDWERVWHQETHSRCREKLISHLYWACEKDIYRLTRRSMEANIKKRTENSLISPFIQDEVAKIFLRTRRQGRRSSGGSITAECCTRVGCNWEEYAEYCPSNKRVTRIANINNLEK